MNPRLYTIREASRLTGLSSEVIRKWEERYGAVLPERLSNGYRGYTKENIARLAELKRLVDQGSPIGWAVQQVATPPTEGRGEAAVGSLPTAPGGNDAAAIREPGEAGERLLDHFLNLDDAEAQRHFDRLLAEYPVDYVLLNILQPTLIELGEQWIRGEISEYQEHFGTHFVREKLLALKNVFPVRTEHPLVVTACGPGETHELGILFFGYFALKQGYRIVHLGTSPSEKGILDCLDRLRPRAFLFSFTTEERLHLATPFLRELDRRISESGLATKVVVGGQIVGEDRILQGTETVFFLSGNAQDTVEKLKRRVPVA